MLYVHMYPGISAMEIKNPPEVWKPTMEKARAIRSSSGARSAAAASSRSAASAARRLSFTGPGHNFWREFLQEDVKREIQQVGKPCWFGMMFFFSIFFWGKHGETAGGTWHFGEHWFWMVLGVFFVGGCYVDHKLVVSNELKGLGKDGHIALLSH